MLLPEQYIKVEQTNVEPTNDMNVEITKMLRYYPYDMLFA